VKDHIRREESGRRLVKGKKVVRPWIVETAGKGEVTEAGVTIKNLGCGPEKEGS